MALTRDEILERIEMEEKEKEEKKKKKGSRKRKTKATDEGNAGELRTKITQKNQKPFTHFRDK